MIESGLMAQLLEMTAPACGLGLCQIGDIHFEPIKALFDLDASQVLLHSMLGGTPALHPETERRVPETPSLRSPAPAERDEGEI